MFTQLRSWFAKRPRPPCFHCGEPIFQLQQCQFDGQTRDVCCHGCRAVLLAIQEAGQTEAYMQQKSQEPQT